MDCSSKALVLSAVLIVSGCSSDAPDPSSSSPVVTDTLGHKFSVSCSTSLCILTSTEPTLKPLSCSIGYGEDAFVLLWSRILTVHAMNVVSGSAVAFSSAEPSRPVACVADGDCTPWNGTIGSVDYKYTCVNAICQAVSLSLSPNDVISLCQADIAWPENCPYVTTPLFASRMAEVGVACGTNASCSTVPADCKQPTAPAGIDAGTTAVDGATAGIDTGAGAAGIDSGT